MAAWARSGAMALTGRADGPALGPPAGFVERVHLLEERLRTEFGRTGVALELDALALLGERAALAGLSRQGDRSCGGACRLLRAGDGWLALSLARPSDIELLGAWLDTSAFGADPWSTVAALVAERGVADLVAGGALLGLPVAGLPEDHRLASPDGDLPAVAEQFGAVPTAEVAELLVVDLSSLWAGPLCAQLLGLAGARIVKVESTGRPDGARFGPPAFFDLLHAGHESVALDFTTAEGRKDLCRLLDAADVVIEASRPRALRQLGIDAEALLHNGRLRVWLSITGYGRTGDAAQRVAFGDDGAVAGGLVVWDDKGPCFCADAVADPLTGLVAATAVLGSIAAGGRWLLDVSLQGVAAHFAADANISPDPGKGAPTTTPSPAGRAAAVAAPDPGQHAPTATPSAAGDAAWIDAPDAEQGALTLAPPRARRAAGVAAPLGAHTAEVLAEVRQGRR